MASMPVELKRAARHQLELLGATALFCQVGVINMGSRIGYSENNVVGYVMQNEVSLGWTARSAGLTPQATPA